MFGFMLNADFVWSAISVVGVIGVVVWAIENLLSPVQIIKSLLIPYFQPDDNKSLKQLFGDWAVVTGCTDGIGRQYAVELAKQGLNIVLISRTEAKLVELANEIESTCKVKTKWIKADFGEGKPVITHIQKELVCIPNIGILVNNVGQMYDFPDNLEKVSEERLWNILQINIGATTMMSHFLVPAMRKRGKGAIINISSGSAMQPTPYMTAYGASKVYVKNFTLALEKELRAHGIWVQLVSPMFVRTKMNNFSTTITEARRNIFIPSVEAYTKFAVFTIGKTKQTTGYWAHGLQVCIMKFVPEFVRTEFGAQLNKDLRKEYYQQQKIKT